VNTDLQANEMSSSSVKFVAATAPDGSTAGTAAKLDFAALTATGTSAAANAAITWWDKKDWTDEEIQQMVNIAPIGCAVPVLNGWSLVRTGHHYIPISYAGFQALMRQAWGNVSESVKARLGIPEATWNCIVFHDAMHPLSIPFKRKLSKDPDMPGRLTAAGLGGAAVRLPAYPSEAQCLSAGMAVIRKARETLVSAGWVISLTNAEDIMLALRVSQSVSDEKDAVASAQRWYSENASTIALASGVVAFNAEAADIRRETTIEAYSVRRAVDTYASSALKGREIARAIRQRNRDNMERGTFESHVEEM